MRFIRAHMRLATVPVIPEIRVHTAGKETGLRRLAEAEPAAPYWAFTWAGGLALARYVLDRPESVRGRRVLDLGTGSGLVAIAAALAGASEVSAADIDPYAVAAAGMNAAANGVAVAVIKADLTSGPPPPVDLVLAGDVFYDRILAERMKAFLNRCLDRGIEVLIGDPGRPYLPRPRLHLLAEYAVPDIGVANAALKPSAVFALEKTSRAGDQACSMLSTRLG